MVFSLIAADNTSALHASKHRTLTRKDARVTAPNIFGKRQRHEYQETLKQACFQGYPESAVYVQIPIGSRNSAIHNAYHTSLRPSSLFEPRHPSLKVVWKLWQTSCQQRNYARLERLHGSYRHFHPTSEQTQVRRRPGTRERRIRPQPAATPLPRGELQEAYNPQAGIPHQQVHMKRLDACE
mgnify:CR=1 FL=1